MGKFDWKQFHRDLDMALAILLTEESIDHLSQTNLITFLELSNAKAQSAPPSQDNT